MKVFLSILFLLVFSVGSLAAEAAFEAMALAVDVGPGEVKEETGRQLARVVFARLQSLLEDRPIKALVVNENLNLPRVIAEEAKSLAGNVPVAVISAEWRNPKYYPAERLQEVSRGIYMAAVTGDLQVEFLHADFLAGNGDGEETMADGELAISKVAPEVAKLFGLKPPKNGNVLIAVPATHLSAPRRLALARAADFPARLIVANDPIRKATIVTTINGIAKTNAPLGVLLKGDFNDGEPRDTEAFSKAAQFVGNPFLANFNDLGDAGVRILEHAKDVEIFRLVSRLDRNAAGLGEIEGYKILKPGARAPVGKTLADAFLSAYALATSITGCGFDPGVAFRVKNHEGAVTALLCLNCNKLGWIARNAKGEKIAEGSRDVSRDSAIRLALAALEGLPGDPALSRGRDR